MKLGTLMYQVKTMIKKVIKSGGDRARFDVTMLTNTANKNRAQPKTKQKGKIFSMMHVVSHRI